MKGFFELDILISSFLNKNIGFFQNYGNRQKKQAHDTCTRNTKKYFFQNGNNSKNEIKIWYIITIKICATT